MVRLFDKEKDYKIIAKWWLDHGQIPCHPNLLPNLGFIVNDMVAGFIYQTDSDTVYFESIVSKKDTSKEERREALNKLIETVCNISKEMGYKQLIFHTVYPHLKQLGEKWDCKLFEGSSERYYKELK